MNGFDIVTNEFQIWRSRGPWAAKILTSFKRLYRSSAVRITSALLAAVFGLFTITAVLTSCDSGQKPEVTLPPDSTLVRIGTGHVTGLYYPTGALIAEVINSKTMDHNILCRPERTGGSGDNFRGIMAGELEFGLTQSDFLYRAFNGQGRWRSKGPQKDLRAILTLNEESLTLVAAEDEGINTIDDLRGKKVGMASPGSGEHQNSIDVLENVGIDYTKDLVAKKFTLTEAPLLLNDGQIDAFFHTVAHPNVVIRAATKQRRRVRLIPVTGLKKLLRKHPYYTKAAVPIKFYPEASNEADVETFATKTTLVTSAKVSNEVVYVITKTIFNNLDSLKKSPLTSETLTRDKMIECLAAPIHPGAMKYYDEAGLVPDCVVK